MHIKDFVSGYRNHPVMFIGTGLSLRYLNTSYTWDSLLKKIALDFNSNEEYYLDVKSKCMTSYGCDYAKVASILENDFNDYLEKNRHGKFEPINNMFYDNMRNNVKISRFKLYIADLLKNIDFKDGIENELIELRKARKNIGSIITTNYDCMIEELFSFNPLIGNDIMLSNPYGSVYKIHGCVTNPNKIIITNEDYIEFERKYELIRAQLLSIFIHNPIIFIGYNIGDKNIKDILKTIFSYVDINSTEAQKIRNNFLLVEYEPGSGNTDVVEHDIDIEGLPSIRINKIKTDNFSAIYNAVSELHLPISAMDIRKVRNVVYEICSGGGIKVSITENIEDLKNSDKVLVIGSKNTIKYEYQTIADMMVNYFNIIEEENVQLLNLINKQKIQPSQFFPVYGFSLICDSIDNIDVLKGQQKNKIDNIIKNANQICKGIHNTPTAVMDDETIKFTYKTQEIICSIMSGNMDLNSVEEFLRKHPDKKSTEYRKILCAYDIKKYNG